MHKIKIRKLANEQIRKLANEQMSKLENEEIRKLFPPKNISGAAALFLAKQQKASYTFLTARKCRRHDIG